MRVIAVNRFFHPDRSATSQILSDVAFALARDGHEVHVVTSRLKHGGGRTFAPFETVDGVAIHRVWTTEKGQDELKGRSLDYLSFHAAAAFHLARLARPEDVVIVKTDPPLLSATLTPVALLAGAHVVHWVQDLFPDVATAAGLLPQGRVTRVLSAIRDRSFRAADRVVAIGEGMAARLAAAGVAADRLALIPNFVDETAIRPIPRDANPLRRLWNIGDRFVVGYSGNLGRAHDARTVLDAAERLRARADILFLMIGGGSAMSALKSEAESRGLANMRFEPLQAREVLPLSLTVPDLHWLTLRPAQEGLIVPSKFYGAAASGRPIVMVGAPDGEIGRLLADTLCGVTVREGDGVGFASAAAALADDPVLAAAMGRRARALVESSLSRDRAFAAWRRLLAAVAAEQAAVRARPPAGWRRFLPGPGKTEPAPVV